MAIYWPNTSSGCRVDLLTTTFSGLYSAVRCVHPSWDSFTVNEAARDIWEQALGLRAATNVIGQVSGAVTTVTKTAANILNNNLDDVIRNVGNGATILFKAIDAAAKLQVTQAATAQKSIIDTVLGGAGDLIGGAGDALGGLIGSVGGGLNRLVGGAGDALRNVVGTVGSGVSGVIGNVAGAVGGLIDSARRGIEGLVTGAVGLLGDVVANVGGALDGAIRGFGDAVGGLIGNVQSFIDGLITNVRNGIAGIVNTLTSIPGALRDIADQVIGAAAGGLGEFLEGIGKFLSDPLEGIIGGFFHGEEPVALDIVGGIYDAILGNSETPANLRTVVTKAKEPGAPIPAIVAVFLLPLVIGSLAGAILAPAIQPMVQEELKAIRPTLLGLGDYVQAYHRGEISKATLYDAAGRAGYADSLTDIGIALGRQLPTPTDLMDWRHRGIIADGAAVERLQRQGWAPEDASAILDASEVIPPVSDLVRFAVREAFPGQAAFGGQRGSGTPARFIELAEKQGLDPEFARSYWAAHWELPSVTAAFSMFHRRLIDESQLRALLKEQDFAPEWIDRIIDVAYDPLTRVDVRRMRALGVLSKAEVIDAYRDIGYDDRNARRLADFTEADIAASQRVETSTERDLTRGDLVGAYADGIMTRSAAGAALREIGYDSDEAELILDREDVRVLRSERKETRSAIVDQVVAGIISNEEAQDKLNAAGYTSDEVKAALREIERKIAAQIKEPTKAELDKFRKFKLITDDEYRTELRRLGYADRWIEAFVKLGQQPEVDNA